MLIAAEQGKLKQVVPPQEGHGPIRTSPEKGHEDDL